MSSQELQKRIPNATKSNNISASFEDQSPSLCGSKSVSSNGRMKSQQLSPAQQTNGSQFTTLNQQPTLASPSNLSFNTSHQASQQHDSINVYGSYIDDSYVGDFSGEVNPELVDNAIVEPEGKFWRESQNLDDVLEFSFESFGPESMLFPRNGEVINDEDGCSSQSKSIGYHTKEDQSEDTANYTSIEEGAFEKTFNSIDTKSSETHNDRQLTGENSTTSITEDSLNAPKNLPVGEKLSSDILFKNSTSTPTPSNNSSSNHGPGNFKRNSSLTQSQRRRIRPKMKIEEIFNASDESNTQTTVSTEKSTNDIQDENKEAREGEDNSSDDVQVNSENNHSANLTPTSSYDNFDYKEYSGQSSDRPDSKSSSRDDSEALSMNQGTLGRKKISANRDLLNADDLIQEEVPRFENKTVNFARDLEESHIPELSVREEANETRNWRESCPIGDNGEVKKIDLKVIEPYKKVLSHGGYYHHYNSAQTNRNMPTPGPAIIIFSACYLPDRSRKDYDYVMNNLFMYVLTTLHELVADDYILIYFHNAGCSGVSSNNMPTFGWLKRCYTMIDRRLRKNLKNLYLVHPTFWLKTFVIMTKPFISSKFARKLKFVSTLAELNDIVPIESTIIPPPVKQYDKEASSVDV